MESGELVSYNESPVSESNGAQRCKNPRQWKDISSHISSKNLVGTNISVLIMKELAYAL